MTGGFVRGPSCLCNAAYGDNEPYPVLQQHCQVQALAAICTSAAFERCGYGHDRILGPHVHVAEGQTSGIIPSLLILHLACHGFTCKNDAVSCSSACYFDVQHVLATYVSLCVIFACTHNARKILQKGFGLTCSSLSSGVSSACGPWQMACKCQKTCCVVSATTMTLRYVYISIIASWVFWRLSVYLLLYWTAP